MTCWLYNTCVLETISNPPLIFLPTNPEQQISSSISSLPLNTCIKAKCYIQMLGFSKHLHWTDSTIVALLGHRREVYVTIWYQILENNMKSLNKSLIWSRWGFCCSVSQLLRRLHDQIDIILPGISASNFLFEFLSAHASFINDNI